MTFRVATDQEAFAEMRALVPLTLRWPLREREYLGKNDPDEFEAFSDIFKFDFRYRELSELSYKFDRRTEETTLECCRYTLKLRPVPDEKAQKVDELFKAGVYTNARDGKHDISHEGTLLTKRDTRHDNRTIEVYATRPGKNERNSYIFDATVRTYDNGQQRIKTPGALYQLTYHYVPN